jgi:RimJ/RimL family protein N-acetyltransferase
MTPVLETRRLCLRPLEIADAEQIQIIFPHGELIKYLAGSIPWPYPPDGALTYCRDIALPAIERGDEWHWTLRPKSDPSRVIGTISLRRAEDHNRGFWLALPWQGQRLMSEACSPVTDYWFDVLRFPVLRIAKAIANEASRRISLQQGMRVVATDERDFVCGRLPVEIWEITAQEWREREVGNG